MAVDVATLVIRIDASQVPAAQAALQNLGAEGVRVQAATTGATAGTNRLNNAFLALARQATGTHPAVARLADVMFSMSLGAPQMTALLAALAAVAVAYQRITRDARDAREENERLRASLKFDLPAGYQAGQAMAASAAKMAELEREKASLESRLIGGASGVRAGGPMAYFARQRLAWIEAEMSGIRGELIAGGAIQAKSFADRPTAPQAPYQFTGPMPWNADTGAGRLTDGESLMGRDYWGRVFSPSARLGVDTGTRDRPGIVDRYGEGLRARKQELERFFDFQEQKEAELQARRLQANQALVTSLANVGRAYGGVTDQVLNLAAATMSIHQSGRLPMDSFTDKAIGYGSVALTGAGFGASTANPFLGGVGGGAAGYSMIGGPTGIVVGAVGGIVSGLISAGQKANQAAVIWRNSLQSFEDMWDELTPAQQTDRAFQQLTGMTPEQARTLVGQYGGLPGQFGFTDAFDKIREALEAYERQSAQAAEQTEKLTRAEQGLYDARFRALNSPTGFNLSYYGWMAGMDGGKRGKRDASTAASR